MNHPMQNQGTLGLDFLLFKLYSFKDICVALLLLRLNKEVCFYGLRKQTSSLSQMTKIDVCLNKKRNYLYD